MGPLALFLVMSFAAYRIIRLVVSDTFPPVVAIRERIVGPDEEKLVDTRLEWFGELITCYWCAGFWVSGAVVGATDLFTSVPVPVLMWWGVAGLAATLSHLEDVLYVHQSLSIKQAHALERGTGTRTTLGR